MKNKWFMVGVSALTLFNLTSVHAWNKPGAATVTLATSYYHFDQKRELESKAVPNASIAYNVDEHWAIEASVGVINTKSKDSDDSDDDDDEEMDDDGNVHGLLYMIDGIYRFTTRGQFEPYVIAGIGVIGLKPNGNESIQSGNLNAGLGTQIFFGDMVALRGEFRDIYATTGNYKNDFWLNFGVSLQFDNKKPEKVKTGFKQ